jgi:hypothetical protein
MLRKPFVLVIVRFQVMARVPACRKMKIPKRGFLCFSFFTNDK